MARFVTLASVLLTTGAAFAVVGHPVWFGLGLTGLTGVALWRLLTCPHPRPLALLPPTRGADGERRPPHWFCAACGKSWPASFEHASKPVVRFQGHDESKAHEAARRAAAYEVRLREIAMLRAGMREPAVSGARRIDPTPIQPRRAVS